MAQGSTAVPMVEILAGMMCSARCLSMCAAHLQEHLGQQTSYVGTCTHHAVAAVQHQHGLAAHMAHQPYASELRLSAACTPNCCCLTVGLLPPPPPKVLYVANLHLEGSPYRPQDRVSQARSALARLAAHMAAHGLHPADAHVVVLGDMNSGAGESVHTLLRR